MDLSEMSKLSTNIGRCDSNYIFMETFHNFIKYFIFNNLLSIFVGFPTAKIPCEV